MYAVLESGGKQYRVCAGQRIALERLPVRVGEELRFEHIVMLEDKERAIVDAETLQGICVVGKALAQRRGEKLLVFKKRRRKNSRRKNGHRQYLTDVEIVRIEGVAAAAAAPQQREQDEGLDDTKQSDVEIVRIEGVAAAAAAPQQREQDEGLDDTEQSKERSDGA